MNLFLFILWVIQLLFNFWENSLLNLLGNYWLIWIIYIRFSRVRLTNLYYRFESWCDCFLLIIEIPIRLFFIFKIESFCLLRLILKFFSNSETWRFLPILSWANRLISSNGRPPDVPIFKLVAMSFLRRCYWLRLHIWFVCWQTFIVLLIYHFFNPKTWFWWDLGLGNIFIYIHKQLMLPFPSVSFIRRLLLLVWVAWTTLIIHFFNFWRQGLVGIF